MAHLATQVRAACGPIPKVNDSVGEADESKRMVDLYRQFLVQPTEDRYRAALLAADASSADAAPSLSSMEEALCEGRYESVRLLGRQWTRFFFLSPRFHRLAAIASKHLGDESDAEMERFAAQACLSGILASGDGSPERPYLICDRADAREVLTRLGLEVVRQSAAERDGRIYDVFEASQGGEAPCEVWFAVVSKAQPALARPKRAAAPRAKKVRV